MALLKRINTLLGQIETALLCIIIATMLGMALLKIGLRYLFHTGILWNEAMVQHFTLALTFLGAALATGERRHINIDVLTRFLPARFVRLTTLIIHVVSLIVVGILIYASVGFVRDERMSVATLVGSVPMWWAKLMIPIGFGLIALHLVLHIAMGVIPLKKKGRNEP